MSLNSFLLPQGSGALSPGLEKASSANSRIFSPAPAIFVLLIAMALAARVLACFVLDLNLMESYGVVVARYPSLSYLDHPPLTWWLIGAATRLAHSESAIAVRAPFILLFLGSSWLLYALTGRLSGQRAALYAVLMFNFSPLFGMWAGALALTDGPAVFFTLASLYFLTKIVFEREVRSGVSWRNWLAAGFFFGCALASKYVAILLLPGLLAFFVSQRDQRGWLLRPHPYVAAAAALLPLLPVLVWNEQHGWASFLFQGGRAAPGAHLHLARALRWTGMQIVYLQPAIFLGLVYVLSRGFIKRANTKALFFCCLAFLPLVFFLIVMAFSSASLRGFHWGALGWLVLFPPLGAYLARMEWRHPAWLKAGIAAVCLSFVLAFAALTSHAMTGWVADATGLFMKNVFYKKDPILVELFDWSDLPAELERRHIGPEHTFLAGKRWEACAKADYVAEGRYPFLCLSSNNIHFSYIADPERFRGWDAIIVDLSANLQQMKASVGSLFASIEEEEPIELTFFGKQLMPLRVYRARDFQGRFPPGAARAGPAKAGS